MELRVYPASVLVVWVSAQGRHFHATKDCWRVRAGQHAKSSTAPLRSLELKDLEGFSPCRTCYPDTPRVTTFHRFCSEHGSARPCVHNGGVYVLIPRTWRRGSALNQPGDVTYRKAYVWPENAHWYEQVG